MAISNCHAASPVSPFPAGAGCFRAWPCSQTSALSRKGVGSPGGQIEEDEPRAPVVGWGDLCGALLVCSSRKEFKGLQVFLSFRLALFSHKRVFLP